MTGATAFYEKARELGEISQRGLRYRMYFDPDRGRVISVLVPGQDAIDSPR